MYKYIMKDNLLNAVKWNLSKLTTKSGRLARWDSSQRSAVSSRSSRRKQTSAWRSSVASVAHRSMAERSYWSVEVCRFIDIYVFFCFFFPFLFKKKFFFSYKKFCPLSSTDLVSVTGAWSLVWGLMAGLRGFASHGVVFYLGAGCGSGSPPDDPGTHLP